MSERYTPTRAVEKALVEAEWALYTGYTEGALLRIAQILSACTYIERTHQ